MKRISIITPSLNRASLLERAIQSVQVQQYENYEHIIMDGGSTDQTLDVVGQYPNIKFFSKPDHGIYDALNKGLDLATGEVIGFLNTDDEYEEDVFRHIDKCFEDSSLMAVAGKAIVVTQLAGGKTETIDKYSPDENNILIKNLKEGPYFNAWFFHRKVFEQIGNFKECYKIAGDRDFMLRFAIKELKFARIDKQVYIYQQHEESLTFGETDQQRVASAKENLVLADSYLSNPQLSKQTKRLIISLHTRETAELALRSIRGINVREFYSLTIKGIKYDKFWPFRFLTIIAGIVPKTFQKHVQKAIKSVI